MASRLLRAGHELTVWNRTPERTAPLAERGAIAATTPAATAAGADFIITMLATPDALEQVVFGDRGLAGALGAGQVVVDMSTVGLVTAGSHPFRRGATAAGSAASWTLPCAAACHRPPMAASRSSWAPATRTSRASGLSSRRSERCGTSEGPGSGAAMKLVVNLVLGVAIVTTGEALALGGSLALPRGMLLDVLADSPIGPIVKGKRALVESGRYPPSFKLRHAEKDLRLVEDAAASAGRELKVAHAARAWLNEAASRGAADLDFAAVVATIAGEEPGG
jgi:3-hydroxyisobutyrate dehydrogenase-like beta-hydroxyacid dehydrogenase